MFQAKPSKTIQLGEFKLSRLGLGTNRITDTPEARKLLKYAVQAGVQLIDTADAYQNGASESTLGLILSPYAQGLVIATKGGIVRGAPPNGSPAYLSQALDKSLLRLKTECIDLYQYHRPDPQTPFAETILALKAFQQAGKIRHIGLSNVSLEQLEIARSLAEIASVQNEYNLLNRKEKPVLDYCQEHGIVFMPYFPLSGCHAPAAANPLPEMALRYQASPSQLVLAWLLQSSACMLPIPGTLSLEHLKSNLAAAELQLKPADFEAIERYSG